MDIFASFAAVKLTPQLRHFVEIKSKKKKSDAAVDRRRLVQEVAPVGGWVGGEVVKGAATI